MTRQPLQQPAPGFLLTSLQLFAARHGPAHFASRTLSAQWFFLTPCVLNTLRAPCALLSARAKVNSFVFMRVHTLLLKHPGWGYPHR